jgi:predicted transcriptional regulator
MGYIEWCAYSLANEERRACLKILATAEFFTTIKGQTIADKIGLATSVVGINLQYLAAIGILERSGDSSGLSWRIKDKENWEIIRRLEGIKDSVSHTNERELSSDESGDMKEVIEAEWGE